MNDYIYMLETAEIYAIFGLGIAEAGGAIHQVGMINQTGRLSDPPVLNWLYQEGSQRVAYECRDYQCVGYVKK